MGGKTEDETQLKTKSVIVGIWSGVWSTRLTFGIKGLKLDKGGDTVLITELQSETKQRGQASYQSCSLNDWFIADNNQINLDCTYSV